MLFFAGKKKDYVGVGALTLFSSTKQLRLEYLILKNTEKNILYSRGFYPDQVIYYSEPREKVQI